MSIIALFNNTTYNTVVLTNNGEAGAVFDNTYTVYLEDSSYGDVSIKYDDGLEDYLIEAKFKKTGNTNLILEDSNGNKEIYEIDIKNNDFDINKKEPNKESSQWKTENVKITVKEDSINKTSAISPRNIPCFLNF